MDQSANPFESIKSCSGTGVLTYGNDNLHCRFEAYQHADGTIVVDIEADELPRPPHLGWDVQFTGTTPSGQGVALQDAHVVSSQFRFFGVAGPAARASLIAAGLDINGGSGYAALRYGIANLGKIPGNDRQIHEASEGGQGVRHRVLLNLGQFQVAIEYLPNAETTLKTLSLTHGIAVTAEATVTARPDQVESVDLAIRKMCYLLTLGQGSGTCWVYRDSVDESGSVLGTFCTNAITKPYDAVHSLIPTTEMCAFVEATYTTWAEAEDRWRLLHAVHAYTDAKIPIDYHELRALKMAVVVEHLKAAYLERTGREYALPNGLYQEKLQELRRSVMRLLKETFPDQEGSLLDTLVSGVAGLNRTSFKRAVRGVAADLRLPLDNDELRQVVFIRDRLVHAMQFSGEVALSHHEQYSLLTTFVGRLILAALGYEGHYYDSTRRPPALVRLERSPLP